MSTGDIKMFDLVIFGASGFTGQYVVEEVAKISQEERGLTWAIAGRTEKKLKDVLKEASKQTGTNLDSVGIIIADVEDEQSLSAMAKQTKLVLNCVGPYRLWGEVVVAACVDNGTHHIDISGEPYFLEKTQLDFNEKAKANNTYVVGACGFDSIPSDMGIQYLQKQFQGDLNSVELFIKNEIGPQGMNYNVGTLHSALLGVKNAAELKPLRMKLFPKPLPKSKHQLKSRGLLFYNYELKMWCMPFPGADKSVVARTQRYNYEYRRVRPVQMLPYVAMSSFFSSILTIIGVILLAAMSTYSWTRALFKAFPRFWTLGMFSNDGATREQIKSSKFRMTFVGLGYKDKLAEPEDIHTDAPDKKMVVELTAPEAGYDATPICMVQAAMVILKESDKLPPNGGVFTAGSAFYGTSLIDRLSKHGFDFTVLSQD